MEILVCFTEKEKLFFVLIKRTLEELGFSCEYRKGKKVELIGFFTIKHKNGSIRSSPRS